MEVTLYYAILIMAIAFVCEYVDSTLGMGYGTTLTPIFLLMGFSPMEIVPAILVSELASGLLAGIFHHRQGNVNLRPRNRKAFELRTMIHPVRWFRAMQQSFPMDLKVALWFGGCSAVGAVVAVFVALNIPSFWLKMYIGVLVLSMGVLILVFFKHTFKFSLFRLTAIGLLASFNKAISGGGYGPLVTTGQVLSGVDSKNAVGITSVAEAITCLAGVILYLLIPSELTSWRLTPLMVLGAVLSVPLSAKSVKLIKPTYLKLAIALLTIVLGSWTLWRTLSEVLGQ